MLRGDVTITTIDLSCVKIMSVKLHAEYNILWASLCANSSDSGETLRISSLSALLAMALLAMMKTMKFYIQHGLLAHKAQSTTAADDKFCDIFMIKFDKISVNILKLFVCRLIPTQQFNPVHGIRISIFFSLFCFSSLPTEQNALFCVLSK